jgi:NADPH:quinone reductase-like Zn-dependent oxidoreductase
MLLLIIQPALAPAQFGGYAEFAAARHEVVFALPDGMSFVEGASLPVNLVTAYHSLFFTGTLFPGDRVLIHAAAGGVGQIAVQMAKNAGCQVFVTASTEAKLSLLKDQFGADHAINYVTSNFAEEVRRILGVTDPKAGCLDVILDPVGGSQLKLDVDLLRPNGRVVSFGVAGLSDRSTVFGFLSAIPKVLSMLTFNAIDLLRYSKSFIGVNMLHIAKTRPDIVRHACLAGLELIKQGKVRTVVSKQLDWNLAGQAHQEMEERKTTGKIVFIVRPTGDAAATATTTANPSSVASSSASQQTTASNPSAAPAAEASSSATPVAPSDDE